MYESHEAFEAKANEYFEHIETSGKKPTLAGLCLFMGFSDKESFTHYETYGGEFSRTVKRVKLIMEDDRQQILLSKDKFTPGVALDLKVNHGWQDKQVSEVSGPDGGPVQISAIRLVGVDPEGAE